jgi:multisubunit Na+/H+ antiporter MnhF subunit
MRKAKTPQRQISRELSHHIMPTASTMIGACITVITFLKTINFHMKSYADEILGCDTFVFITACFLSYISIRNNNAQNLEIIADNLFLIGMVIMVWVGLLILFLE